MVHQSNKPFDFAKYYPLDKDYHDVRIFNEIFLSTGWCIRAKQSFDNLKDYGLRQP